MSLDRLFEPGNTMRSEVQPDFQMDSFDSTVYDEIEKEHEVSIKIEYYTYDRSCHIAKCEVETKADFEYLKECIIECIEFRLGKTVHLDCSIDFKYK